MKSLIKNTIWLVIYLLPILAVIYYRAFIFTADFNKPIDNVLDSVSSSTGITVPSYQLASNEQSLYGKYLGDSATTSNEDEVVSQHYTVTSNEQPFSIQQDTGETATQNQPAFIAEVEESGSEIELADQSDNALDVDQIVSAVKETVNETLESFMDEKDQQVEVDEASILSAKELLFKARLAYWNGDLKTAENAYIQLTEMVNDDPNAYGELGNLYYMQAKWKKASDAYYQAAIKLSKTNNADQAQHLLRIIRGLDTETADKLQAELNHTS